MIINILKKEDSKIYFKMNESDYEFNYDGLDTFIASVYSNKEEVSIECDDELNEYKQLLEKILEECRKDDYIKAVNDTIESQKNIDDLDEIDENTLTENELE